MGNLIYRRVFADPAALRLMLAGRKPDVDDIKRRVFVMERQSDHRRPDHFYKGYLEHRVGKARNFVDLINVTLGGIGDHHLEWTRGRAAVKLQEFEHWQHGLPFFSPLAVAVHWLRRHLPESARSTVAARRRELEASLLYSALLSPVLPGPEELIRRDGLNEMHMHLTGSTELDIVWIDAVQRPEVYRDELEKAFASAHMFKELYDQIDLGLDAAEIHYRLAVARNVRWSITRRLLGRSLAKVQFEGGRTEELTSSRSYHRARHRVEGLRPDNELTDWSSNSETLNACLTTTLIPPPGFSIACHPVEGLYSENELAGVTPLHKEALWLWHCFDALEQLPADDAEDIALGLYFSFLTLTLVARLTVQQVDEFGFDQFQKYTLAGAREPVEAHYAARFRQLGVSNDGDHDHLEGRFSPKETVGKNADLLESIVHGYLDYRGCGRAKLFRAMASIVPACLTGGSCSCRHGRIPRMKLGLVAHFIKKEDKPLDKVRRWSHACRHQELRTDLETRGHAFLGLMQRSPAARHFITGIDAAANELHAPPETFAPLFRMVRRARLPHASYHAGEDFRHLVSGIRAVVEAVEFLDLRNGDRVGHATALGIDPALWLEEIGPRLMLKVEDALDDAVFAYHRLSKSAAHIEAALRLEALIGELQLRIYRRHVPIPLLVEEWRMRTLDARLATMPEVTLITRGEVDDAAKMAQQAPAAFDRLCRATLSRGRRAEITALKEAFVRAPQAFRLFQERHLLETRRRGAEIIEVRISDYDERALHALQMDAISLLNSRNVIIETLPTSNVRISYYDSYKQHHLFRWLGVAQRPSLPDTVVPTVCVGSDDTGIFSTSLRNEYAHIYLTLVDSFGLSADQAMTYLEQLNRNGRVYRFHESMPAANI